LFLSGLQNFVIGNEVKTLFVIAELLRSTSPVRDGMSVENIPHPVRNPVMDDMLVADDMSAGRHTGIIPDGILLGE
jgi:hypothetical protein